MRVDPAVDPTIFDAVQFAMVQGMILPERLAVHLRDLDQQLLSIHGLTGQVLQERAHKIIAQAGMLGLMRLSERARELENVCRCGEDTAAALLDCREAGHDVRRYALPAISTVGSIDRMSELFRTGDEQSAET